MLANSLKIGDHSNTLFFQLTLPIIHGKKKDNSDALLLSAVFGTR